MNNKELVETIDNIGQVIFDMEFKGKDTIKIAEILKALNAVRNELNSRPEETEEEVEDTGKE